MINPEQSTSSGELAPVDRSRIASTARVSAALIIMVSVIVAGLTGLIFVLVSSIFDSITPATAADLEWIAKRGAIELSTTAQVGLLLSDEAVIRQAARDYVAAADVVNVLALGEDGTLLFRHGNNPELAMSVFALAPNTAHTLGDRLVAWAPAKLEGQSVGRVAVAVSTSRLLAGHKLRRQMMQAGLFGGVVAMSLCAAFVALYIVPVLRLTQTAFKQLEHTTQAALEAARLKAQFLANMSHEIRTPMNAVVGLSKLMLDMPLSTKLRRYAEMIDASSRALLSIINDILDFSKIEAGKYEIILAPAEPAQLVQEVVELLGDRAQSKNIDLVYRIAPDVPRSVEADGDRVRQVLTNLVGNAVKFTERGQVFVQLLAERSSDGRLDLRYEVHDTGVGVPEEMRDQIFEAFSQADGSLVRKHGGTGLGLTISRQLVALMGGTLGLTSEAGRGSCFWFKLPGAVLDERSALTVQAEGLAKRALIVSANAHAAQSLQEHAQAWGMDAHVVATGEAAEQALRDPPATGADYDVVLISETHGGLHGAELARRLQESEHGKSPAIVVLACHREERPQSEPDRMISAVLMQPVRMAELHQCLVRALLPGSAQVRRSGFVQRSVRRFAGTHVLVVDDNEMNQVVAVEQLLALGCTIDQAFNGQQAVDKVLANEYPLVLMDCQMPIMDGYTATREIRKREQGRRTVIVALTAHALQGERERVLEAGMDDYLTKPMRPITLQRTLERWVKGGVTPSTHGELQIAEVMPPDNDVATDLSECSSELLQMLLDKLPVQLELLDGAIAQGDRDEARAHAHKLKGSLLTVDATDLAKNAQYLQQLAERDELDQADDTLTALLTGYQLLEKNAKAELSRRARGSNARAPVQEGSARG